MPDFMPGQPGCKTCPQSKSLPPPRSTGERSFGKGRVGPDGSISYPRRGFEPPPPIDGYERAKGDPWKFIPLWPKCTSRIRTLQMKKCGAYNVLMACACDGCPLKQQLLSLQDCQNCPHRTE